MTTVADIAASLPLRYDECKELAVVFDATLCQRLVNAQAWYGDGMFFAQPIPLTDSRWFLPGSLLSEVPVGLYGVPFQRLNAENFSLIEVLPYAEIAGLQYGEEVAPPLPMPEDGPPPELEPPESPSPVN